MPYLYYPEINRPYLYYLESAIEVIKTIKNWPLVFLDHLKLVKKSHLIYELRNGIKYKARSYFDQRVIREIWCCKRCSYIPKGFDIQNNDVVLDIGAHIGVFSILASMYAKNGKVYSFEPTPESFDLLKQNIKLNKAENIVPINKAVSDKNGEKEFYISSKNQGGNALFPSKESEINKIIVQTTSLNKFIKENKISQIDFLKIDCEGGEYEILFSCSDDTLNIIDKISMEYHYIGNNSPYSSELKGFLENHGFSVTISPRPATMLYATKGKNIL